jgi:predicted RNase H-like HicB family nuclease
MEPIQITYQHYETGWHASSADLKERFNEVVASGGGTYEEARARVMDALRWSLENPDLEFEHFVHESAIPALLAEREQAKVAAKA